MAAKRFLGQVAAVAQVNTLTVGGTIETTDIFNVTIGVKTVSIVAGSTVAATVATSLLTALQASVEPEFLEITWASGGSGIVSATANTAGKPFTLVLETTETGGGAADDQTFVLATTTANRSPYDAGDTDNWSGGALPAAGDEIYIDGAKSMLYRFATAFAAGTMDLLVCEEDWTGTIGLPEVNTDDSAKPYDEYRDTYCAIDCTAVEIRGAGTRIKLNLGTVQSLVNIYGTGPTASGIPACLLLGTHAANVLNVNKGSVGVAFYGGEVSTFVTVRSGYTTNIRGDVDLVLGAGCTLTTVNVDGGEVEINAALTTLNMTGNAEVKHREGAITTANVDAGLLYYIADDTCTTLAIGANGAVNFEQDKRARTVTNCSMAAGAEFTDPARTVTGTNGIDLVRCGLGDVSIDIGKNLTITTSSI